VEYGRSRQDEAKGGEAAPLHFADPEDGEGTDSGSDKAGDHDSEKV